MGSHTNLASVYGDQDSFRTFHFICYIYLCHFGIRKHKSFFGRATEARNSLKWVNGYSLAQQMGTWLCVTKHRSSAEAYPEVVKPLSKANKDRPPSSLFLSQVWDLRQSCTVILTSTLHREKYFKNSVSLLLLFWGRSHTSCIPWCLLDYTSASKRKGNRCRSN